MSAEHVLSAREIEIARDYAAGSTYQAIAERLCIAPATVRTHLATIYRKLEVSSKLELHARLDGGAPASDQPIDHAAIISELALDLEEALSREKALSEVLKIIGGGRGNLDQVIPAILGYALDLCDAEFGILFEISDDSLVRASFFQGIPDEFKKWFEARGAFVPNPGTAIGRMVANHEVMHIVDVRAESISQSTEALRRATIELGGARTFVAIPILAGDELIGAFTIYRQKIRPFDENTIRLAALFASQSAIALENARLVSALRAKPN